MDNENKWEYDYSSQDKNESGDTGYPNVGSSGMNTANQYNDPQPEPETAYTAPQTDNGAGGATPPVHPVQPQDAGQIENCMQVLLELDQSLLLLWH